MHTPHAGRRRRKRGNFNSSCKRKLPHQVQVYRGGKDGGKWEFSVPMSQKRESFICDIYRGRIWACGGENRQFSPTRTCESWHPGEAAWRGEISMNELRFMGTSAVTPVGLFAIGGNGEYCSEYCSDDTVLTALKHLFQNYSLCKCIDVHFDKKTANKTLKQYNIFTCTDILYLQR